MRVHKNGRPRGRSRGRGVGYLCPNDESFLPRMRSTGRDYLPSRRDSGYLSSNKETVFLPSPRASEERDRSYSHFVREDRQRARSVGAFMERRHDCSPKIQRNPREYMPSHREFANTEHLDFKSSRESKEMGRNYSPYISEIQRREPEYPPNGEFGSRGHIDLRSGRETMGRQHGSLHAKASTSFAVEVDRSEVCKDFWGERSEYEMKCDRDRGVHLSQQSHFDDRLPRGESYYMRLHSGHYSQKPPKLDGEDKSSRGYAMTSSGRGKEKHLYEHNFSNVDRHGIPDSDFPTESHGVREFSTYYTPRNFPRTPYMVGKSSSELENNDREGNNIYFNGHLPQTDDLSGYMMGENPPSYAKRESHFGFNPFEAKSSSYDTYKPFTSQCRSDGMLNDPNPYDGYDAELYEYSANSSLKSSDRLNGHHRDITQMHGNSRDYIFAGRGARDDYPRKELISLGAEDSILTGLNDDSTIPMRMESRMLEDQYSQERYVNHDYVGGSYDMKMHDEEMFGSGNRHLECPEYRADPYKVCESSNLTDSGWSNRREFKESKVSKFTYKPGFDRRSGTGELNMYRPSKERQANKLLRKRKQSNLEMSAHNAESLFLSKRSKLGLTRYQKIRRFGETSRHNAGKLRKLTKRMSMLQSISGSSLRSRLSAKKHNYNIMNEIIDGSHENTYDDACSPPESDTRLTSTEPPEGSKHFRHLVHEAFLKYIKQLNEDPEERRKYLEQGEAGTLRCIACGSDTGEFTDIENLVTHAFVMTTPGSRSQHLGLHQALCLLRGWKYEVAPNNTWLREELSEAEYSAIHKDLIIWPPVVIVHDISMQSDGSPTNHIEPTPDMLKTYFEDAGFGKALVRVCWGKHVMVVAFRGTLTGLDEAERLHKFFDEKKHGRGRLVHNECGMEGATMDGVGSVICGYMGIAWDFDKLELDMKKGLVVRSRKEIRAIAEADVQPD